MAEFPCMELNLMEKRSQIWRTRVAKVTVLVCATNVIMAKYVVTKL